MTSSTSPNPTHQPEGTDTAEGEQVMGMLGTHVPLSLIMDLAAPAGPHSQEILDSEGQPETTWWVAP
ncbi:MAG TPA: hypothetical protein VF661_10275 [Actinomycetales bacterium]|jgi:hypothetical protein